ncbi:hypothetical protein BZG82_05665 [Salinivibrio sp. PR5]|uniref:hypothetical protein n=1 Tax=Salinivibrio sp. PR5 TaxID=1909484 RepID=UPI00098B7B82|nr:hypothetical protein [Salinivibrio sp. PR5]OOF11101.1 hypothetical protein BZG82_05665 [Salinivibrio sp. PR5]
MSDIIKLIDSRIASLNVGFSADKFSCDGDSYQERIIDAYYDGAIGELQKLKAEVEVENAAFKHD